jgi:class 3 adenylate cyclase
MQDAVRRHDAVVQAAIAQRGGHVFKTAGDAFYSAFSAPQDAVAAMLAAQQALNAEDFSAVDGLRVRAAIHTGGVEMREGDYFGPAVNKVARLLAIGHGGQVLLTAETAALVADTLPADVTLRDLGAYHLKDIAVATTQGHAGPATSSSGVRLSDATAHRMLCLTPYSQWMACTLEWATY